MAEQKSLEWYEYDKAEDQIAVLQSKMELGYEDLKNYDLSPFSRNAIINELERHRMFISDIKEQMHEPEADTEPLNVLEVSDEL